MSTANKMVNEEEVAAAKSSEVLFFGNIRIELLQIINM